MIDVIKPFKFVATLVLLVGLHSHIIHMNDEPFWNISWIIFYSMLIFVVNTIEVKNRKLYGIYWCFLIIAVVLVSVYLLFNLTNFIDFVYLIAFVIVTTAIYFVFERIHRDRRK